MFRVNEVLKYDGQLFRILAVLGEEVVWINIEDSKAFPSLILDRFNRDIPTCGPE
jgi:hypothetical protein